jgi:hypothetical protein
MNNETSDNINRKLRKWKKIISGNPEKNNVIPIGGEKKVSGKLLIHRWRGTKNNRTAKEKTTRKIGKLLLTD